MIRSAAEQIQVASELADLGAVVSSADPHHEAAIATFCHGAGRPSRVLKALARGRHAEGRAMGVALALEVLAETLGRCEVRLALDVLGGGALPDGRLVDFCEAALAASGVVAKERVA